MVPTNMKVSIGSGLMRREIPLKEVKINWDDSGGDNETMSLEEFLQMIFQRLNDIPRSE